MGTTSHTRPTYLLMQLEARICSINDRHGPLEDSINKWPESE